MLLETLRCEEGKILHLSYHQERLERSLITLGFSSFHSLEELISPPSQGTYRCRFLYNAHKFHIEFHPYLPKVIRSLKAVFSDSIEYPLKSAERQSLNDLRMREEMYDDVLIVKNGFLSDTTIANIALKINGHWLTPDTPLLRGTTRERLIREGILVEAPLRLDDALKAEAVAVMNAMMGFAEVENGIIP